MSAKYERRTREIGISTILSVEDQARVDAAGLGIYRARHRRAVREVIQDVRKDVAKAVVISADGYGTQAQGYVSALIRQIPRVPAIALLTSERNARPEVLLQLGRLGIRDVVDFRKPAGWSRLRDLIAQEEADELKGILLGRLRRYEKSVTKECWQFLETLVEMSRRVSSVRRLAASLEILPSTLMSRFFRAGLPAPKRYLAVVRLVRAAFLFENQGFSIANVANHLDYSSPQSFGRHIRAWTKITALEFRRRYRGEEMLDLFEEELILPYSTILARFMPLSNARYDLGAIETGVMPSFRA
jgi:AraC-like DNA-binding protein